MALCRKNAHAYSNRRGTCDPLGKWNISGSQCELNSVPTSTTKSVDHSDHKRVHRQISTESSMSQKSSSNPTKNKEKSRYLRDRLDSITTAEVVDPEIPSSSFKRVNSYHKAGLFLHGEGTNEVEPYAWLSQTAPASPLHGRSRSSRHGSCSRLI